MQMFNRIYMNRYMCRVCKGHRVCWAFSVVQQSLLCVKGAFNSSYTILYTILYYTIL